MSGSGYYVDAINALLAGQTIEVDLSDPLFNLGSMRVALHRELQHIPKDLIESVPRFLKTQALADGKLRLWLVSGSAKLCYTVVTQEPNNDNTE